MTGVLGMPMRILLVFPPQWTAAQPYAAMASLNAELRRAGHDVQFADLNLEFWEYVLKPQTLALSRRRLDSELNALAADVKLRLTTNDVSEKLARAGKKLNLLDQYRQDLSNQAEQLVQAAQTAAATLRDGEGFYQPARFTEAMGLIDQAFTLFSRPFWPASVSWNDASNPAVPLNLAPLLEFCQDYLANPFRVFLDRRLPTLLTDDIDLVAISVGSFSQVIPGLTLAHLVRTALKQRAGKPVPHLSLGGNFFSRLLEPLRTRPDFFHAYCDSLMVGEGEGPIVKLAHACSQPAPHHQALRNVPNLLFLDEMDGRVEWTGEQPPLKMAERAFMDLRGFELQRYLSPDTVLCISASKGCYYGKCAFCDSHFGLHPDQLSVDRLVQEIRHLRDSFGVRHFEFIDQCISPESMEQMCAAFIREHLDIRWFCNARTEPGFTPELLTRMREAGATMVMWGVECASPRLLKLMRKGIPVSQRMDILRASAQAGLWNFAYVFFGFPTETREEAQATIDLICQNTDVIHSYGRSVFTLGKHSPLMAEAQHFGVLRTVADDQELSTNLSYETDSGLSAADLNDISAQCMAQCKAAYGEPLWMALRSRENLHLYLARYGPAYVSSYSLSTRPQPTAQPTEFIF